MKAWSEFYDHVLPDVPDCNPAMADIALRHSVRQFCEGSLAWHEWRGPLNTAAAINEYEFEIATSEEVVKLLGATLNDLPLTVRSFNDLPMNWKVSPGVSEGIVTEDRRTYFVVPARASGMKVKTWVALKPSLKATGVTDAIFSQYVEQISMGAKSRLMMSPKKPYTDMNLGALLALNFKEAITETAIKVAKSFSRTPRRVKPMFF